CQQYKRDPLTF
nr:immunoglobulin light chain junction region [Macaca mulatta]MOV76773.1 immunoglobulin light chain junction region [Macaca mulatta]MOV77159.1 immunoglobulin light chain junction region [Macaca mulatta]MOV77356.1 immunoglobulin light chain junction region [Macaca mulatta]